jgi:hypothetical protein
MVWLRDLSVGLRAIRRNTPLSIAVALTLVVGVGMNSLVVSLFNGLLFRPAVTRDPPSFVQLYVELAGLWHRELHGPRTLATLEDLETVRGATRTLAAVTASRWASFSMNDTAESLRGAFVSVTIYPPTSGRCGPDAASLLRIAPGQAASRSSSSPNAGGNGISEVTLRSSVARSA